MMRAILAFLLTVSAISLARADGYDPLKVKPGEVVTRTFEVRDPQRGRTLPVRIYLPEGGKPAPVILFSHGLGGSRDNNPYLGNHWAGRGYVVVFIQHPGSDEAVWMDAPLLERMQAMKRAASIENFLARAKDVPVVLDQLAKWNGEKGHPLNGRLDPEKTGMSGHSFGAHTTQAVAGQSFPGNKAAYLEKRIDAALMMSPSPPAVGDPAAAFASIRIPCLLMTGTRDDSPIGNTKPADRLKVYPNLTNAPAWQIVFDGATHMDFGEQRVMRFKSSGDPRYHRAILALSTAFWDANLMGNAEAKAWLNGGGVKSVLTAADSWQRNPRTGAEKPAAGTAAKPGASAAAGKP